MIRKKINEWLKQLFPYKHVITATNKLTNTIEQANIIIANQTEHIAQLKSLTAITKEDIMKEIHTLKPEQIKQLNELHVCKRCKKTYYQTDPTYLYCSPWCQREARSEEQESTIQNLKKELEQLKQKN
jgi:hypothetical protein